MNARTHCMGLVDKMAFVCLTNYKREHSSSNDSHQYHYMYVKIDNNLAVKVSSFSFLMDHSKWHVEKLLMCLESTSTSGELIAMEEFTRTAMYCIQRIAASQFS